MLVEHFWHGLPSTVFNFLLLMGAVVYFGRRPLRSAFDERAKNIERAVKKNNEVYAKTLEEFDHYGKLMEGLKTEREELIQNAHKEGKRLVEQLKVNAQKTVESYNQDVGETVETETAELRRILALDLLDLSMKKLAQEMKQQTSSSLKQFYVDQFKKDGNKANLAL